MSRNQSIGANVPSSDVVTKELLLSISKRLSSRKECRRVEYEVDISKEGIYFNPKVEVFRSRYQRTDLDKVPIEVLALGNIVNKYMMEWILGYLVPGKYVYRLSVDKKRRQWTKVSSKE